MFLLLFSIRDLFSTFHSLEGSTEFDPKPHIVSLLFTSCGCPHNFVDTPHFLHHSLPVRVLTFCSDSRFYDSKCPNTCAQTPPFFWTFRFREVSQYFCLKSNFCFTSLPVYVQIIILTVCDLSFTFRRLQVSDYFWFLEFPHP